MRVSLVLLLFLASTTQAADTPEQKVLDRFVGTWKTTFTAPKAEWTPEPTTGTAVVTAQRILGGTYVEEKHANGDGSSGLVLRTYDTERRAFRSWWFSSTGLSWEATGTWDEKTSTLTTKAEGPKSKMTIVQRFNDADTLAWVLVVTAPDGKLLFKMEGVSKRVPDKK